MGLCPAADMVKPKRVRGSHMSVTWEPKVSQPWTLIYPGSLSSSLLSLSFFKFYLLELHCCQDKALSLSLSSVVDGFIYNHLQPMYPMLAIL